MLLSDALHVRGIRVLHLMQRGKPPMPHKLTKFARCEGERITYPPYDGHGQATAAAAAGQHGDAVHEKGQAVAAGQHGIGRFFKPAAEGTERAQGSGQGQRQQHQEVQPAPPTQHEHDGAAASASTAQKQGIGRYFTRLSAKEAEEQAERGHQRVAAADVAAAGTSARGRGSTDRGEKGIAAFFQADPASKRRKS